MQVELTANMVGIMIETIDEQIESKRGVLEMFVEDGNLTEAQEWLKRIQDLRTTRGRLVRETGINPRR